MQEGAFLYRSHANTYQLHFIYPGALWFCALVQSLCFGIVRLTGLQFPAIFKKKKKIQPSVLQYQKCLKLRVTYAGHNSAVPPLVLLGECPLPVNFFNLYCKLFHSGFSLGDMLW